MLFAYLFEGHAHSSTLASPRSLDAWKSAAILSAPELRLLDSKLSTAEIFAEIRGRGGISSGDAIHLACAAEPA